MPEIKRGSFSLNLGLFQVQAEVSEDDRQCAWGALHRDMHEARSCRQIW